MQIRRIRLVWILVAVAAILAMVGVVSGVVYLVIRESGTARSGQDPLAAVEPDRITPGLALYPLSGAPVLQTIDAAIATGELETAYAWLTFSVDMLDRQRLGRLLLLGNAFAQAGNTEKSGFLYRQAVDMALLSPDLNDPLRSSALMEAAEGWASVGQEQAAAEALAQALTIATSSPSLHKAQRLEALAALRTVFLDLGDDDTAAACAEQIRLQELEPGAQPPASSLPVPQLPVGDNPVSSPEVGALEETRRQAAYALLQSIADGQQPSSDLASALAQALQAEDEAKLALYGSELSTTTQPGRRIEIHWQVIRWLLVKHQVASKALGLSLVPGWESEVAEIQSALTKESEDLLFDYEDFCTALPDVGLVAPGRYAALRLVTLAGLRGIYPNYPAEQMLGKLQSAAADLIPAGRSGGIYVDGEVRDGAVRFFLSPATEYARSQESGE